VEPPLGIDIEAVEPVGEPHEQARSTEGVTRSAPTGELGQAKPSA
jgi:hypothetical protein